MTELINKEELLRRFADFGREIPKDQVMAVLARIDEGMSAVFAYRVLENKEREGER